MAEKGLTKPQIISELTKSPHGDLKTYVPTATRAATEDPDFYAHLIAWNALKGQIRDAKVALPTIATTVPMDRVYTENALAHLAALNPREFLRALEFSRDLKAPSRQARRLVTRYLRDLEANYGRFERVAVQHRGSLKALYTKFHVKPSDLANDEVVRGHARSGRLAVLKTLATLDANAVAGVIRAQKLPFLIIRGALGARAKEPEILVALIDAMSPTELVTNTKALERLGMKDVPAARAAYEQGLEKAASAKRQKTTLKTTAAADALAAGGDEKLATKLRALQEKQLDALGGIEGNWLVLGDMSGSMAGAIEVAKGVAAILARIVKGSVYLVFFDSSPRFFDVTGKTVEEIRTITRMIKPEGSTSIGCGLQYIREKKLLVDGIAIVTDGGENCTPYFAPTYAGYTSDLGVEPTIYVYGTCNAADLFVRKHGLDCQTFDIGSGKIDYYSLPNLVQTMRVGRYSLLDEVLATELLTLDEVLTHTKGMEVLTHAGTAEKVGC